MKATSVLRNFALGFFFIHFVSVPPAFAQDAFICVADSAAGFNYDSAQKKWRSTTFRANGKYLVSKSQKTQEWEFKDVGDEVATSKCRVQNDEDLVCDDKVNWELLMNRSNRRFIYHQNLGYWTVRPMPKGLDKQPPNLKAGAERLYVEGKITPYTEIGTCSPIK